MGSALFKGWGFVVAAASFAVANAVSSAPAEAQKQTIAPPKIVPLKPVAPPKPAPLKPVAPPKPVVAAPPAPPKPAAAAPAAPAAAPKAVSVSKPATPAPSKPATAAKTAPVTAAAKKADDDDDDDNAPVKSSAPAAAAAAAKKEETRKEDAKKAEAKRTAEREKEPEPEPPQTLAEMFARMTAPPPAPARPPMPARIEPVAKPAAPPKPPPAWGQTKVSATKAPVVAPVVAPAAPPAKSATANTGGATAARSAAAGAALAAPLVVPVAVDPLPGRQVLAPKLSAEGIATAVGLGFKVATTKSAASSDPALVSLVAPDGMSTAQAQQFLREALPAQQFFLNHIYRPFREQVGAHDDAGGGAGPFDTPDCPNNRCYAQRLVGWDAARLGRCAAQVKIGVIDTAHDVNHPAFADRKIAIGKIDRRKTPISPNWHGTGVLAILAGSPTSTTPGLLPDAQFVLVDVFFGDSRGQPMSDTETLVKALWLMDRFDVNVVNLSLAGPRDAAIEDVIARMTAKGVVFVAAAGNEGPGAGPSYPAAYKGVIAVTAVNRDGYGYRHANQGSFIDLAAPGVGIWTAAPGRKEAYLTGTSFAAPYVTAAVAAMQSYTRGWSKERLLDKLEYKDLGAPGKDPVFGRGLMKAPQSCSGDTTVASGRPAVPRGGFQTSVVASDDVRASLMRVAGPESTD